MRAIIRCNRRGLVLMGKSRVRAYRIHEFMLLRESWWHRSKQFPGTNNEEGA